MLSNLPITAGTEVTDVQHLFSSLLGKTVADTNSVLVLALNGAEDKIATWQLMLISTVMMALSANDLRLVDGGQAETDMRGLFTTLLNGTIGDTDLVLVLVVNETGTTIKTWRLMTISDVMAVLTINDLLPLAGEQGVVA